MGYVLGEYPVERAVPWVQVDQVYGIGYVKETSHWVCYKLKLRAQEVVVYDYLCTTGLEATISAFQNLLRNLPIVLEKSKIWETLGKWEALKQKWDLTIYKHTPQQTNLTDCGVLAFKFMECLVTGKAVEVLKGNNNDDKKFSRLCYKFKKSVCVELCEAEFIRSLQMGL